MLSVFICEDDIPFLNMVYRSIHDYISKENYDLEIALCTSNPHDIVRHIESNKTTGLYFMDVELGNGNNGVELARSIRKHDPRGFIAFVTSHPSYMQAAFEYQVEAMAYINKAIGELAITSKIYDCIDNAYKKYITHKNDACFIFKSINSRLVACDYEDILFFETDTHKDTKRIILHTKKRQYTMYGKTIKELSHLLPQDQFYKCSKSSIVNINHLTEDCAEDLIQNKGYIIMPDGTECAVADSKNRELLELINAGFG